MPQKHLKKLEELNQKITKLKEEQKRVEDDLSLSLTNILKKKNAFSIDFETLIGGIIHVIETTPKDPSIAAGWKKLGAMFLKSRSQNTAPKMAKK